jgi:hypothetical protein
MFVRSLLAMSLSCILANVAFAAPTTEQPLNPKKSQLQFKILLIL